VTFLKSGLSEQRKQKLRSLQRIYAEIGVWNRDRETVPRIMAALNPCADLAIVGEAVGPKTLRFSGVNYFRLDGRLGDTGRYLDEMLSPLGFTVYPPSDVTLAGGAVIQAAPGAQRQNSLLHRSMPRVPRTRFHSTERKGQDINQATEPEQGKGCAQARFSRERASGRQTKSDFAAGVDSLHDFLHALLEEIEFAFPASGR
jgi:hypothetical protein